MYDDTSFKPLGRQPEEQKLPLFVTKFTQEYRQVHLWHTSISPHELFISAVNSNYGKTLHDCHFAKRRRFNRCDAIDEQLQLFS